jgi:hypothetical protein
MKAEGFAALYLKMYPFSLGPAHNLCSTKTLMILTVLLQRRMLKKLLLLSAICTMHFTILVL